MVSEEDATDLYNATNKLLQIATGQLGSGNFTQSLSFKDIKKGQEVTQRFLTFPYIRQPFRQHR